MALLTATGVWMLPGCLVTDKFQLHQQPDFPPSIVSRPSARDHGTSLDEVVRLNLSDTATADGGTSSLTFPVTVRDPNTLQGLVYHTYLDFDPTPGANNGLFVDSQPIPSGQRDVDILLDKTRLTPGCHKFEMLVSSRFVDSAPQRDPVEPGDLGSAVWWLAVTDSTHTTVEMTTCPP